MVETAAPTAMPAMAPSDSAARLEDSLRISVPALAIALVGVVGVDSDDGGVDGEDGDDVQTDDAVVPAVEVVPVAHAVQPEAAGPVLPLLESTGVP